MKLYKAALVATLLVGGCDATEKGETVKLEGIVTGERYMPASEGWGRTDSRYSFAIDTKYGRKAIEVEDCELGRGRSPIIPEKDLLITKESIDALVTTGTKVLIQKIPKSKLEQQHYWSYACDIKVLGEK